MDKYTTLGIYIEYTHEGTHELMSCNYNSTWVKLLGEITELKQIDKPLNQPWSLELLQKIESGHVIRVICPNAGRNDYICASIYVPWNIVISGKELSSIVSSTRDEIMSWRKETSKLRLTELFSKKYDVVDFQRMDHCESSSSIAYRYYGDYYQLHELLENIEQPYYSNYKFIFLVNNNSNILLKTGDDLTKKDLVETTIVTPPGEIDGFAPYIGNTMFNKPLRVAIGESITLSWIRKGYKTISKTTKVTQKDVKLTYPQINEHEVEIPFATIRVYDEKNRMLNADNYRLRINGKSLEQGGEKVYVNFTSLKNVRIDVTPNDTDRYEVSSDTYDFSKGGYFNVQLERVQLTYEFQFPLKNGMYVPAKFTFRSRLNSCPFKDYNIDGSDNIKTKEMGTNYLKIIRFSKSKIIKLSILVFTILMVGIGAGLYISDYFYQKEISDYKRQISTLTSDLNNAKKSKLVGQQDSKKQEQQNWNQIIDYLDNNNKWERSAMEKFSAIRGLWDALNNYEFENILQYKEELKESKAFTKLVKAIKANKRSFNVTYCNEGDTTITISKYIEKLGKGNNQTSPQTDNEKLNQHQW